VVHAHALGYEGGAPGEGGDEEEDVAAKVEFGHGGLFLKSKNMHTDEHLANGSGEI
jgi:hypothetical protein